MKKLELVHTDNYMLLVSDEEIKEGDYIFANQGVHKVTDIKDDKYPYGTINYKGDKIYHHNSWNKVVGYQPKNNAPELDLPLLPETVVEDDVEKLACNIYNLAYEEYLHIRENVSQTRDCIEAEYEYLGLEIPNKYFDILSFIAGYNYKAATKVYSEEDLRKAFEAGMYFVGEDKGSYEEFIQSLKQPKTPKWFVAEIERYDFDEEWCENTGAYETYKERLKTTTINNKIYLVGTYLYE